jgi:hypothetical protein
MFTATIPKKYSTNDPALIERYCQIFQINWKDLSRDRLGALVFTEMPKFWQRRAEYLNTQDASELLKDTPVEGAHSLEEYDSTYKRLHGC